MAYTNMSGTSDTDLTGGLRQGSDALGPDATTDALGEPEVIEVVEVETYEPTPAGYANPLDEAAATANRAGFQWWMVPAVALPVAAGATAVVLLLRQRQQQPAPSATYNRLAQQSRDWMDAVRGGQVTKAATKALQQGVESVRTTAKGLPDSASSWRDSAGDLLGVVATSAAAKQATEGAKGLLDSVTSFWNTSVPNAKQAAKEQGRKGTSAATAARSGIFGLFAGGQAQDAANAASKSAKAQAKQAAAKANKAADKAKPLVAATTATASVKAAKAAQQTNRMAKRAGKRANNAAKRTRAFTFGMLVAATATYWRAWRQRLMEKETRETAGGRMVKA